MGGYRKQPGSGQENLPIPPSAQIYVSDDWEVKKTHHEIFSASTVDQTYFLIDFGGEVTINPSVIPHPILPQTWIIVAQLHNLQKPKEEESFFYELGCNAIFKNGMLQCLLPPVRLPYPATATGDKCHGKLKMVELNVGPHDARVFYGPNGPYTIFGSNALFTCFSMWMQDFRPLVDDWGLEALARTGFTQATELQRPSYHPVEKNWFVFWDTSGQTYAHYDVAPNRSFAQLSALDGSVGPDLAPAAAKYDSKCMSKYMPLITDPEMESIHQATNSLSITLCSRNDPTCHPDPSNTFILTIFQQKSFYYYHSVYEPYVMLFRQDAPFEIYGISKKPIWIHGRGFPGEGKKPPARLYDEEHGIATDEWSQTQMLYITSVSWKAHSQRYHGYTDDVLFLGFGIEDSATGGIDVLAGDLIENLGMCNDV